MSKKFLAKLLIFCMIFTMLPTTAFGAEVTDSATKATYTIAADVSGSFTIGGTETSKTVTLPTNGTYNTSKDTVTVTWVSVSSERDDLVTATLKSNTVTIALAENATVEQATTVKITGSAEVKHGEDESTTLKNIELGTVTVNPAGTYSVNIGTLENGTVTADKTSAKAGDKVILTVTPATGYKLDTLTVKDANGAAVTVAADNTFEMPASNVTVTATFVKNVSDGYTLTITGNDVQLMTVGTKNTLTAIVTETNNGSVTMPEISDIPGAALTWTTDVKDVVTLAPNGKTCVVTAGEVEKETEVVVTATLTVPEVVVDKDNKTSVATDENGNAIRKTLASAEYLIVVTPVKYTIAMKDTATMELLVNGTAAEKSKTMEVVVKADDKEVNNVSVIWSSSDEKVATVNTIGTVTAVGYGRATITATVAGTAVKAVRTVNVAYKPVKVTFDLNYNGATEPVVLQTNNQGKLAKFADTPTREDYKFMGWFTEADVDITGKSPVELDKVYTEDTTLKARWVEKEPLAADVKPVDANGKQESTISGIYDGQNTDVKEGSEDFVALGRNTVTFDVSTKVGKNTTEEVTVKIDPMTAASFREANVNVVIITNIATITLDSNALQDLAKAGYDAGTNNVVLTVEKDKNVPSVANYTDIKMIYAFTLKYNGTDVLKNSSNKVKVSFEKPATIKGNTVYVYLLTGSNTNPFKPVEIDPVVNGNIVFTTSHFSDYAVSDKKLVYTITFKPGTATGEDQVQNVTIPEADKDGKRIAKVKLDPNPFNKPGATFAYWTPGNHKDRAEIEINGDITLTAVWKDNNTGNVISDSNGTGGGGGGSSSNVSIATKVTGGKVTVTPTRPTKGQIVTITVSPADGYKLDSLKVTDNKGNEIELTKVSDTKYTFEMPAGKVTVTPAFVKVDGSDKKDENTTNVSKRFSDVASDAWYAEYINYVAENGLMNGYEDGRFGPNDKTTRAQIVTVLYRMEGEPAVQNASSFSDVSAGGQYYSSAVAWASRNSIVNGYEDGRFGPNDNVTREQIAAILYRFAQYKGYDTTLAGNIASFSDSAKVSSWANAAIAWAVGEGLMNGDNGALRPQGNATRAEIAALLMRFCENIAK